MEDRQKTSWWFLAQVGLCLYFAVLQKNGLKQNQMFHSCAPADDRLKPKTFYFEEKGIPLHWTLVCTVCLVSCAHNAHHHGESTETDNIRFNYDPTLHHFVAITSSNCFMVLLTHDEQDHVHTTTGIEDLELKMMREWIGQSPEVRIYHDDTHLPDNIKKWCASKDIYLLVRDVTETSSPKSPLLSNIDL